jgi:NAD+ synthase (glutamine-hydrolysing)
MNAQTTGIDGDARVLHDGSSMVIQNGEVLAQGSQFSLAPVEVTVATVDIEKVRSYRSSISRNVQAAAQPDFPRVECDLVLSCPTEEIWLSDQLEISQPIELRIMDPMEEIYMSTSVYLWQYLTRTNSAGFFLALSGGLDSSSVALFVYGMARLVLLSIESGAETVLQDLRRVTGDNKFVPQRPEEIVSRLLHTCYMGTVNSSEETQGRAKRLAGIIGAYHSNITINETITAHEAMVKKALGFQPKYEIEGGSRCENLARQNIQARSRMVIAYSLAQLSTTARNLPRAGSTLLVLGSGNVDEVKYDLVGSQIFKP